MRLLASLLVTLALGTWSADAQGNEITLIAPGGIRAVIEQLLPGFERKTGYHVKATFGSGLGTKAQVVRGDPFDVPIVQPPCPEVLASGNVVANSATPLASVTVGVALQKGAPKPDISTPAAVKRTLLAAKSIAYPDPAGGAAAGVTFEDALRKLGIFDQLQPKIRRAQGGAAAMALAAKGEVEIGVTFLSEMQTDGLEVVGPLPREIAPPTTLVGFVSAHAKDPVAAKALLAYLTAPDASAVYQANGMQPGSKPLARDLPSVCF